MHLARLSTSFALVLGLAAAGLLAVAVFLALNPHLDVQLDYLGRIVRVYSERAELADLDRTAALRSSVTHLLSPGFHGLWIGLLALAGTFAVAGSAIRQSSRPSLEPPAQPAEETPGRSSSGLPRALGRPHPRPLGETDSGRDQGWYLQGDQSFARMPLHRTVPLRRRRVPGEPAP